MSENQNENVDVVEAPETTIEGTDLGLKAEGKTGGCGCGGCGCGGQGAGNQTRH